MAKAQVLAQALLRGWMMNYPKTEDLRFHCPIPALHASTPMGVAFSFMGDVRHFPKTRG
jgi:hypothetical protein